MADSTEERQNEFKEILKEHVSGLKSDISDTSMETDEKENEGKQACESAELHEISDETIAANLNEHVQNETGSDCLMLCGRILRLIGDEATCRACGKSLRNIGDEIFCNYATRNMVHSLLNDLSESRTTSETVR
jgi:hypothetical protein